MAGHHVARGIYTQMKKAQQKAAQASRRTKVVAGVASLSLIALLLVVGFWPQISGAFQSLFNFGGNANTGPATFRFKDGVRPGNPTLSAIQVDVDLYCLPTTESANYADWSKWLQDTDVANGDDLQNYTFKATDCQWAAFVSATGIDAGIDEGVDYYVIQHSIAKNGAQDIFMYETPNLGAAHIEFNSVTGAWINTTGSDISNLASSAENFTVTATINMSQPYAAYKSFHDFTTNAEARLTVTFTLNGTSAANYFLPSSTMTCVKNGATGIALQFDYLGVSPVTCHVQWSGVARALHNLKITKNTWAINFNGVAV
nr:hypothetical protein [Candidatus Sigynarchaeota archaeon]